jgi:hypothetical protein
MIILLFKKIQLFLELLRSFGLKYSVFRLSYELQKKYGILAFRFPVSYPNRIYPNLSIWKKEFSGRFFVQDRESIISQTSLNPSLKLKAEADKILSGQILFFSNEWREIGFENESFVHPLSKYKYPSLHWTKLPIYSSEIGDIKYIWEKSKFSFLLTLIRNDIRNESDNSEFVFNEIRRWIKENPPNIGPQYICSQEISIRLINWSFALFFYKNSKYLDENLLNTIFKSIEVQLDHIYQNINFSKIAVRNNHAVSETLALYLISLYYPFLKNAKKYKSQGKKWFENEIEFQIFDDGSDSQYSFNYHRVKIQLLSLAISSARVNNECFRDCVYSKSIMSLEFLLQVMGNHEKGFLPNFGPNDGSIYFKLNDADYRNFIPQINALASLLEINIPVSIDDESIEDEFWFTSKLNKSKINSIEVHKGKKNYENGGYLQVLDSESNSLLKTPFLKFRAAQNDLLNLDIWYKGINVLKDAGSYSYNTDEKTSMLFNGISGHNTFSLNGQNHMLKGPRFTWLFKPKMLAAELSEDEFEYKMQASMYVYFPKPYILSRTVYKLKGRSIWEIEDSVLNGMTHEDRLVQFWNLGKQLPFKVNLSSVGNVERKEELGYESVYYGIKSPLHKIILSTKNKYLKVRLEITE